MRSLPITWIGGDEMMSKTRLTVTGLVTGMVVGSVVGALVSGGKSATKRLAKNTVKAAEMIGDRMQSMMK